MKHFIEFITEKVIHYFDLDDTLFSHGSRTGITVKNKGVQRRLSTSELTRYKHQPGDKYDFSEFRSSHHFEKSARPIKPLISRLRGLTKKHKVEILTGRADMDDKEHFGKTLAQHGIDFMKVHVRRTGNMKDSRTTAERKARHISDEINKNGYTNVHLYDDSIENLNAFLALKSEHPNVAFHAHHVHKAKVKKLK